MIVVGTGLEESMVAASAARNGHSVLHVDTNDYYGETWVNIETVYSLLRILCLIFYIIQQRTNLP